MSKDAWKRLRRELRARLLLLFFPLLSRLPGAAAVHVGAALGWLAWWALPRHRHRALAHLEIAFPETAPAVRARIGRASFANLGRCALELPWVAGSRIRLAAQVELGAAEKALLAEARREGNGVLFVSCHLGNWELLARRIVSEGYRAGVVAREPVDARLSALLERSRASFPGLMTLWRGKPGLAREMLRLLRQGDMVGLLIDQDTRVRGHFVPFFGRQAFTPRVVGDLAVRTRAAVLFGTIRREGSGGKHRILLRRLEMSRTGDPEDDSLSITAAATRAIEDEIRRRPEEWVWMHERWRTRPDDHAASAASVQRMS